MRGAQLEIVEVDTFPAHGDLDHAMKLAERKTRRHQNAPPNHRADPDQPEFDLEDRVGVRREVRNERLRPSFHAARLLPLRLSVAGHPRDPDAPVHDGYDRLGMVYEARGENRQAAECYRKVIAFIRE